MSLETSRRQSGQPYDKLTLGQSAESTFLDGETDLVYVGMGTNCVLKHLYPQASVRVRPVITGPNTLWWFNGLTIVVSGYANEITLTASGPGTTYQWAVSAGSSTVQIKGSGQNASVQMTSIGQSKTANDVSVTVTVGGVVSDPFNLTVKAPYQLGGDPNQPSPVYVKDPTYVWDVNLYYTVEDNFGVAMPVALPVNESFGAVVPDYAGTNWRQGNAACLANTNPNATFYDDIGGETPSRIPTPVYNPNFTGVKVLHFIQDWRVGTCVLGSGPRVQSDTIQKWTDHALHTGITSPNP